MFATLEPLRLISVQAIVREPLPPIEWIVQTIVSKGERVLLYGEFGALKTWLLLHMGLHIAAGRKWLGCFEVPKPKAVLYVDEEMTEYAIRLKVRQLVEGSGLGTDNLDFQVSSREGVLFTEMGGRILLERVRLANYKPEVIVIDSMRATLVGSENEQMDVIAFWRAIEPLLKAGITVLVAHHMRKPREEGPDPNRYRASGSTAIISGSDSAWAVTRHGKDTSCTLEAIRIRMALEPPPFAVGFQFNGETGPVVGYMGVLPSEASQGGQALLLIEKAILDQGEMETAALEALCASEGISRATCYRAIHALTEQGRIHASQKGHYASGKA